MHNAQTQESKQTREGYVPFRTQKEIFLAATFLFLPKEKPSFFTKYSFLKLLTTTAGFWEHNQSENLHYQPFIFTYKYIFISKCHWIFNYNIA